MARRHIHYEAAFEDYLRSRGLAYGAVDESRKAIFAVARVRSLDFRVLHNGGSTRRVVGSMQLNRSANLTDEEIIARTTHLERLALDSDDENEQASNYKPGPKLTGSAKKLQEQAS